VQKERERERKRELEREREREREREGERERERLAAPHRGGSFTQPPQNKTTPIFLRFVRGQREKEKGKTDNIILPKQTRNACISGKSASCIPYKEMCVTSSD
jgi:hypothetical protein